MNTAPLLHHIAEDRLLRDVRVSDDSLWHDPEWSFAQTTAGKHRRASTFSFNLVLLDETDEYEAEHLTDERFATLLDEVRRFVHSLIVDARGQGGQLKTSGISNLQTEIHFFLRWMVGLGYMSIGDIPASTIDGAFLEHLIRKKVGSRDEDSLTDKAFAKYIAIPIKLHEQSGAMPEGVTLLRTAPFAGRTAIAVAQRNCRKAVSFIPAVPMGTFVPVMSEALSWVGHKAWDVKRIHDATMEVWNSDPDSSQSIKQGRAARALAEMTFGVLPGKTEAWHQPITDTVLSNAREPDGGQTRIGVFQQLRRLLMHARDSSVCLIQGLVALRISEVCSLQAEPFNEASGMPACVVIEPTLNGIYEAFYLVGRIYKGQDQWDDVRWAAGLRPRGTDVVPPAVQAVLALYHVFKPYRDWAGLTDLVLGFSNPSGLPKSLKSVTPVGSTMLGKGQGWWMADCCGLPDDTHITSHMWRKTYAVQLYRSDPSLLPAISQHFKHVDTQHTYSGYIRDADPDLLMMVDEISMAQDAEMFRDIRHGRVTAAGGFYDMLVEGGRRSPDYLQGLDPQEEADVIHDELMQAGIRSHECGWGRCLYRSEWSRCGGGRFGPSETGRSPSTCAGCANLLVLDEHNTFWMTRRATNQAIVDRHLAAGDDEGALVSMDRVAQCDAMLAIMDRQMEHA